VSQTNLSRIACAVAFACWLDAPKAVADDAVPTAVRSPEAASRSEEPQLTENADKKKKDKPVREGWYREDFSLRNGKSKIEITGYAQTDFRHFDWDVQGDETGEERSPESEFRRFRMGLQGEVGKFIFEIAADPRESEEGSHLKDATIGYEFSKHLSLLVGHFKPPISQEFLTSASKTDFVERAMLTDLAPDRDWGAAISGEAGRFDYAVGGFAGDGDGNDERSGSGGAGRLSFKVTKGLSVAASYMQTKVEPDLRIRPELEPDPKGAPGHSLSGFTFWNRAHVNGTRKRLGGDLVYSRGPFRMRAEFLQMDEQRKGQGSQSQDIPDIRGRGWTAGASYVLTGEKKGSTVEVEKSVFRGGRGALEIAARVEGLKFDDTGDPSGFAGFGNRASNIAASGASVIEAGLNYWAANYLKFQFGALWEKYNDPLIAPVPGNTGRYFTLQGRVQVMVP
jgi:phosphate-selective porin OprO and OprP